MPTQTKYTIARSDEIAEKGRLVVDIGTITVGVFRVEGQLYAYENTCPHQGGPVCQGLIIPGVVELLDAQQAAIGHKFDESDMRIVCPWHGYEFSIKTGCHPAKADVRLNPIAVSETNGDVHVEL